MTVATATKPATKPATVTGKAATKPAKLTGDELEAATAAIVNRWNVAEAGEAKSLDLFKAAGIAWENSRVIKVRVAFAAAMLVPNGGKANLLNASRILLTDAKDFPTAGKRTEAAKSRKNSIRNYVEAGEALEAAGLDPYSILEPTDAERKAVATAFREGNKRDKAEAAGDTGEGAEGGESEGTNGEGNPEALTIVDIVGHIARMNKTLELMTAASVAISEADAGNVADMLNGFQMKLSAYAEGK